MLLESKSSIDIYKSVLKGNLKRFPQYFWESTEDTEIRELLKYFFKEILKYTDAEMLKNIDFKLFKKYKLSGLLAAKFNSSPFAAVNFTYPNKFKQWEFNTSKDYWNLKTAKEATIWFIEEKMHWNTEDIKQNLNSEVLQNTCLNTPFASLFNCSPFKLIDNAYPSRFKEWEIATPKNYWNKHTAIKAVKWLIKEKLHWTEKDVINKLDYAIFKKYSLQTMLEYFNYSPFKAINAVYPGKYKEEDFKYVHAWSKEKAIKLFKDLLENKLKWNEEQLKENLTAQTFIKNGLAYPFRLYFKSSPFLVIDSIYPKRFNIEDFKTYRR